MAAIGENDRRAGAFEFAQSQVERIIDTYPSDYYPMDTVDGRFGRDGKRWTHSCDGFYPGMMFIFTEATGSTRWLDAAVKLSTPLEVRQYDRSVHDLGFLFFSTHLRWLDLGGPKDHLADAVRDVGRAVAAIARGDLPFSTGEVINADGGFHLRTL